MSAGRPARFGITFLLALTAAPFPPGSVLSGQERPSLSKRALQLEPGADATSTVSASEGWAAYARGDVAEAARLLAQAAAEPGAPPWVHYALGFARLAQADAAGAVRAWERVRHAAPQFKPVYFDLADGYLQTRAYGTGVLVLRDAERRWPDDPEVRNALGVVQVRRGALDDAVESFRHAVRIAPDDPAGHFNLGRAHQLRYVKSRRYNTALRRWFSKDEERDRAAEAFRTCVTLGGPYVTPAREALVALAWH